MKFKIQKSPKVSSSMVNKLLKTLSIICISFLIISCSKKEETPTPLTTTPEGVANITLTAGGQQFKLNGPCQWVNAAGVYQIAAKQVDNPLKIFTTYFNIPQLPAVTTTYPIVEDNTNNPLNVEVDFFELGTGANPVYIGWYSTNTSGTFKVIIEGNKVTVNLAGITLKAGNRPFGYSDGNIGPFANNGTLSGTLTFYK